MAPGGSGFFIFLFFFFLIFYEIYLKHGVLGPYESPRILTQHKTSQNIAFKNAFKTNSFLCFCHEPFGSAKTRSKTRQKKNIGLRARFLIKIRGAYSKFVNFLLSNHSDNLKFGAKFSFAQLENLKECQPA